MSDVDPVVRKLAENYMNGGSNRRAAAAIKIMLEKGSVTTDDLNEIGYNHPPRAIGDVRDAGIPVVTGSAVSTKTGKRMASYSLGSAAEIVDGRIAGRSVISKAFKEKLLAHYGPRDGVTGRMLPPGDLTVDHRVPFRVSGDVGLEDQDVSAYMLLDRTSQRQKAWECQHCPNQIQIHDPGICRKCYWASPEAYEHVATVTGRRVDIHWHGDDVAAYERLLDRANRLGISVSDLLRRLADGP